MKEPYSCSTASHAHPTKREAEECDTRLIARWRAALESVVNNLGVDAEKFPHPQLVYKCSVVRAIAEAALKGEP